MKKHVELLETRKSLQIQRGLNVDGKNQEEDFIERNDSGLEKYQKRATNQPTQVTKVTEYSDENKLWLKPKKKLPQVVETVSMFTLRVCRLCLISSSFYIA